MERHMMKKIQERSDFQDVDIKRAQYGLTDIEDPESILIAVETLVEKIRSRSCWTNTEHSESVSMAIEILSGGLEARHKDRPLVDIYRQIIGV